MAYADDVNLIYEYDDIKSIQTSADALLSSCKDDV